MPLWNCAWGRTSGDLTPSYLFSSMGWSTDRAYMSRYPKLLHTPGLAKIHPHSMKPKPAGALWAVDSDNGWWIGYPGFIVELARDGPGGDLEAGILAQLNACMTRGC